MVPPMFFYCVVFGFFFSSRRRHTRLSGDWSSDVCSSDLDPYTTCAPASRAGASPAAGTTRSEERRVGKSVDLGGRRIIKKKKRKIKIFLYFSLFFPIILFLFLFSLFLF